ncbi:SLOG family protein [Streptomyces glaucescens]|uniref:SLOG family protein n=1 Tax=Streptomyces glaucescens TaxID=1907 RepID=UPI000A364494|nr:SLOG family protein [Streptomyces glaucescens]
MNTPLALIGLTGSRRWPDPRLLEDTLLQVWHDALQDGYTSIELMHGCAEGADTIGGQWARRNGLLVRERPADWTGPCGPECQPGHRRRNRRGLEYCPLAGHRRNQQMVDERPALFVAAQVAGSTGTADCIRRAQIAGIPVHRITTD